MKGNVASLVPVESIGVGIVRGGRLLRLGLGAGGTIPLRAWQAPLGHTADGVGRHPRRAVADWLAHVLGGIANHEGRRTSRSPIGRTPRSPTRPKTARSSGGSTSSCLSCARRSRLPAAGTPILCTSDGFRFFDGQRWTRDVTDDPARKAAEAVGDGALISGGVFERCPRPRTRPRRGTSTHSARVTSVISTVGHGPTRFTGPVRPDPRSGGRARTSNIRLQRPTFCRLNYPGRNPSLACLQQ